MSDSVFYVQKSVLNNEESYEQSYNEACRLIAVEKFDSAKEMLQKSLGKEYGLKMKPFYYGILVDLCQETLTEEGVGDDEIAEELAILK